MVGETMPFLEEQCNRNQALKNNVHSSFRVYKMLFIDHNQ